MQSLSKSQARKLALLSQCLSSKPTRSQSEIHTLKVIEQIGYVQIDTISVVERAHHHVLWSRNANYQPTHLDKLVADRKVFEYWSHAAAYLPMCDYRYTLRRKHALKSDEQSHWFRKDLTLMNHVIERITSEGPLMAKDFESEGRKVQGWGAKPTKQALENLFMQGDLMIAERRGFHKVYDLTERVLPSGTETSIPSVNEHAKFLIIRYLRSHGIGNLNEFVYLLKHVKADVKLAIDELIENGDITNIDVAGTRYLTTSTSLKLLEKRLNRQQVKILSPFDNALIQRKRALNIFDFDYQIECYVPEAKRQFGYFCLPILWGEKLVARADCKAHRQERLFEVKNLYLESSIINKTSFMEALDKALTAFMTFNQCDTLKISNVVQR